MAKLFVKDVSYLLAAIERHTGSPVVMRESGTGIEMLGGMQVFIDNTLPENKAELRYPDGTKVTVNL